MKRWNLIMPAAAILLLAAGAAARQSNSSLSNLPDLEGGWLRLDTVGGGDYTALDDSFPRAQLTPQYAPQATGPQGQNYGVTENTAPHQAGEAYVVSQPGAARGGPGRGGAGGLNLNFGTGIDSNSAPFFLIQTKGEVLITREGAGPGRHIFMDGRAFPDPSNTNLNPNGYSVGHYENGKLVIETTDFSQGGTGFGHGFKGPHTKLTETFNLSADGQHLKIHYKYDDPEIYEKPLEYDMSFDRLPKGSYAFESWGDQSLSTSYTSVVPPPQK